MKTESEYSNLYQLKRIIFIAGSAAASVTLAFLFLQATIDIKPLQEPPPVDQMMYYLEFFGFATIGYFASAILIWRNRNHLQPFIVPWIPVCVIGSIFCSAVLAIYIYIANKLIYTPNPLTKPVTFTFTLWAILVWSVLFFFISCPISALTSTIYTNWVSKNEEQSIFADVNKVEKTSPKA